AGKGGDSGAVAWGLGSDQGLETAGQNPPEAYGVTLGMLEQRRSMALRGVKIPGQKSDRTRALTQHAAKAQGMSVCTPFLNVAHRQTLRLVGEALQPQNARAEIMRREPQIEREYLGILRDEIQPRVHAINVATCVFLVAEIVQ